MSHQEEAVKTFVKTTKNGEEIVRKDYFARVEGKIISISKKSTIATKQTYDIKEKHPSKIEIITLFLIISKMIPIH